MSRTLVRAIIIKDNKLLVINRNKFGKEYSTLPGGLVGINENPEQAVVREISEEAMIEIANPRLVFIDHADFYGDQLVYLCEYVSGEPKTSNESSQVEWVDRNGALSRVKRDAIRNRLRNMLEFTGEIKYLAYLVDPNRIDLNYQEVENRNI